MADYIAVIAIQIINTISMELLYFRAIPFNSDRVGS
jgi:hypothetical protein